MKEMTKEVHFESVAKSLISETEEVIPFTQTPSEGQFDDHQNIKNELRASDLFSFFTANIIKEEIVFTR